MTEPVSLPPRCFQRTIVAWTGSSAAPVGRTPGRHRVMFRTRSVAHGRVVLGVDLDEAWLGGVRELAAGPLGALLDAALEAAAQTVFHAPLHPLSIEVEALESYRLRAGPVTLQAQVVEALGSTCLLEGRVCTASGRVLATARARFGPLDGSANLAGPVPS